MPEGRGGRKLNLIIAFTPLLNVKLRLCCLVSLGSPRVANALALASIHAAAVIPYRRIGLHTSVRTFALLFCVFFGLAELTWSDQIVLQNGDRLTGTITKSDNKSLVIKTEFAGEVTVQWPAIQQISSTQPLHVGSKDGRTVSGDVKTADGSLEVAAAGQPAVIVPKDSVTFIRDDAEEAAYDKSIHPRLTKGWTGGANVSFALTRGNSETKNLALAFTAARKTAGDDLSLYANSVFASDDAPTAFPHTTAQSTQGGARYDRNFGARMFGFAGGDFQTDALQSLDLRSVLSGGLGVHAIKTGPTTLDFLGGANYTRENYSTLQRDLVALTIGEELMRKIGPSTVLTEKLYIYPDLNDTGEYRAAFNFGTVTKLSKWLGWQNAFGDIYVTNPPVGKERNDLQLTTGLNVAFSH
jgi:putative salt-induced outer membrane protein YdiY